MIPEIKAWREFSKHVESRLKEKYDEGYDGWDGKYPTATLAQELTDDALLIERGDGDKETCVDVAARAMMLHRREEW